MNIKAKEMAETIGGMAISVGMLLLGFLIPAILIIGVARFSAWVMPWLSYVMWGVWTINFFLFLPLVLIKKTRQLSALVIWFSSYIYGATLWLWALLLTYTLFGMFWVIVGLFIAGIGVVPIAIIGTLVHAEWILFIELLILLSLTYGSRVFGKYVLEKNN